MFNESALLTTVGGKHDVADRVLASALKGLPQYMAQFDEALAAGNGRDLARITHTMKGLSAQIGAEELAAAFTAADRHLKAYGGIGAECAEDVRAAYRQFSEYMEEKKDPTPTAAESDRS